MKVWGLYPGERLTNPSAKPHWIELGSGVHHNPPPRTAKGKRRHEKRTPEQKKHAEATWR